MENFSQISVERAREIMQAGPVTIADIRDADSFKQGHIPQAQNISDDNVSAFLQGAAKEIPLICCCYHGISSQRAAGYFAQQGFKEVYSIDGGWEKWKVIYG